MSNRKSFPPYLSFLLFNLCFFMMDTMASYFSIYMNEIGFTKTQIGTINGMGSLCALACQPFFGMLADRSKSKNRILQMMILGTAILYPLILLNQSFIYILIVFCIYCTIRRFQPSLNTSMSVEYAEQSGKEYGPIRTMGAIGYALMMALVSRIAGIEPNGTKLTFFAYTAVCLLNVLLIFLMPPIRGHNRASEGKTLSPMTILKNKPILALIIFQMLISLSQGLWSSFFSIYFIEQGGTNAVYGMTLSIAAALEIPFLFFTDKFVRRLGARRTLLIIGLLTSVRWFGTYFSTSVLGLQIFQCLNFVSMVESVAVSITLSRLIVPQFKTTVQSLAVTFQSVVSVIVSSFLGGRLADLFGIRPLFFAAGTIALTTTLVFCLFIFKIIPENGKRLGEEEVAAAE